MPMVIDDETGKLVPNDKMWARIEGKKTEHDSQYIMKVIPSDLENDRIHYVDKAWNYILGNEKISRGCGLGTAVYKVAGIGSLFGLGVGIIIGRFIFG